MNKLANIFSLGLCLILLACESSTDVTANRQEVKDLTEGVLLADGGTLVVTPTDVNLGCTRNAPSGELIISVENISEEVDALINTITFDGIDGHVTIKQFVFPNAESGGENLTLPLRMGAAGSGRELLYIYATVSPIQTTAYSAQILINDQVASTLSISPVRINFETQGAELGVFPVGETQTGFIIIQNTGSETTQLTDLSQQGWGPNSVLEIVTPIVPLALSPGESVRFEFRVTAQDPGEVGGIFSFGFNNVDCGDFNVKVTGTAIQ